MTAPYWLLLGAYAAYRTTILHGPGHYGATAPFGGIWLIPERLSWYVRSLVLSWNDLEAPVRAFHVLSNHPLLLLGLGGAAAIAAGRLRWAMLWCLLALLPTINRSGDHHLYIPSVGLSAFAAGVLYRGSLAVAGRGHFLARVGALAAVLLFELCGTWRANAAWREASAITRAVPDEVRRLHPTLPHRACVLFFGLPDNVRGAYAFRWGLPSAIAAAYGDPSLLARSVRDVRRFPEEVTRDFISKTAALPQFFFRFRAGGIEEVPMSEIRDLLREETLEDQPRAERGGEDILRGDREGQTVTLAPGWITRIDVRIEDRPGQPGHALSFRLEAASGAPGELARTVVPSSEIAPGSWQAIRFERARVPADGRLYFEITSPESHAGDAVALLGSSGDAYPGGVHLRNGQRCPDDLAFRIVGFSSERPDTPGADGDRLSSLDR
ncbi:MAG: hypothetical protein U0166_20160 [Acidobacteriota bacterium]